MSPDWASDFSFVRGAISEKGSALFSMVVDKFAERNQPHSVLQFRDAHGVWLPVAPLDWSVVAILSVDDCDEFIAIGELGHTATWTGREVKFGRIDRTDVGADALGKVRCAGRGGRVIYAAGMGRSVSALIDGKWVGIDEGVRRSRPGSEPIGFETILVGESGKTHAAGWHGELWTAADGRWERDDLPVNTVITASCRSQSGRVYFAGRRGLLVYGQEHAWNSWNHEVTIEDFWGAAALGETSYFSTMRAVYCDAGGRLSLVDFGADLPATCYGLAVAKGRLLSIGPKDVMCMTGGVWHRWA